MDNLCHTLVGAACGTAGLNRYTRFAPAALMISANLPDVDVLVFATDTPWIEFRRGWTHGVVAQLLLPVALTAGLAAVDRFKRSGRADGDRPFHIGWTLALCLVGVYTHVFLDYLNNYGVRLATPFSWQWFYGDAVFIIDPLMWLALGAGVWLTGSKATPVPSRTALAGVSLYVALLLMSGWIARGIVHETWREARGVEAKGLMVGPMPFWPLTKQVIVDAGDHYETGVFNWWGAAVTFDPERIPKNSDAPEVAAVRDDPNVRAFLVWARFPFWTVESRADGTRVVVSDMRFAGRNGFSASALLRPNLHLD
jgi:inner membrane protein